MAKTQLTEYRIDQFRYDPAGSSEQCLYDLECTGLFVRVSPKGSKSFGVRYGHRTNRKRVMLGRCGVVNLEQARAEYWKLKRQEDEGYDLVQVKKAKVEAKQEKLLLPALIDAYLNDTSHEWSESYLRDSRRRGEFMKDRFGSMMPEQVTPKQVTDWVTEIAKKGNRWERKDKSIAGKDGGFAKANRKKIVAPSPIEADQTRKFVLHLYSWASDPEVGYLPQDHPNPAYRRRRRRSKKAKQNGEKRPERKRVLAPSLGEYRRLLLASDEVSSREGAIVRLYLLTGVRRNELLMRRWEDIDWDRRVLVIPAKGAGSAKNGKQHEVPLCDRAIELLLSMREEDAPDHYPVVRGRWEDRPIKEWKYCWKDITDLADLDDWGGRDQGFQVRDLRRTCGTWLREFRGYRDDEVGVLLNHTPQNRTVTSTHYHTEMGANLKLMRKQVSDLEEIMKICEEGHEEDTFKTEAFPPSKTKANGS